MATFTETDQTLDIIKTKSSGLISRTNALLGLATQIQTELNALGTDNAAFITQLNTDAAANATDPAWQDAKARKDQYVADYQATLTRVNAMVTALTGL